MRPFDGEILTAAAGPAQLERLEQSAHARLRAHAMELGLVVIPLSREGQGRLARMAVESGLHQDELAASIVEMVLADDEAAHEPAPVARRIGRGGRS